jgi:protein SCO1/2
MIKHIDLEPGADFDLVTISFDPTDEYTSAKDKRDNYKDLTGKKLNEGTWKFLTGDSMNIKKITDAVGFKYIKQDKDFAHASGIVIISPDGKIIRYLFGIMFLPLDVKLAIAEADEGITGPSINKVLKFCYSYDPEGRKYTFNLLRVVGSGMLLTLVFIFVVLAVKKNKPVDPHPRKEI